MRDVVNDLRNTYQINGRTIHVADKGLNCADNIASFPPKKMVMVISFLNP